MEECHNNKTNLLCCFIDFRKAFDTVLRKNLWDRLEETKLPIELRATTIRLYENVIANFRNIKGWLEEINYNIGLKQGFPLSPTLFGICIDKLEDYFEEPGFVGPNLSVIFIILPLYDNDIVLFFCEF
jgi:hypothetical protein